MADWNKKDRELLWHPFTSFEQENLLIESGEGIYLHTSDGRKIIDAVSSWWVNIHGHSHPELARALSTQASILEHVIFAGFTHKPAIQLGEQLLEILPDNQRKIFFSDNGSTAVEVSLKMAMQYFHNTGQEARHRIITLEGAYHGDTFGAMSVAERNMFTRPFQRYLFQVEPIPFPDHPGVLQQFKSLVDTGEVAAFIFEPLVQGVAGMRMYDAGMLDSMIAYAQSHDVICIADEVFTGFGRTGKYFACHYLTQKPDILAISKGLTGGMLPMGITSCSEKISEAFRDPSLEKIFFHGHSYTGNPLTCAVALTSLRLLRDNSCQENIKQISRHHESFRKKIAKHPNVLSARNLGTILAIELNTEGPSGYDNDARKKIYSYFLNRDILLRPLGNVIYVLPPYVIQPNELEIIYSAIEDFLTD